MIMYDSFESKIQKVPRSISAHEDPFYRVYDVKTFMYMYLKRD